jgi:hypothetical protein
MTPVRLGRRVRRLISMFTSISSIVTAGTDYDAREEDGAHVEDSDESIPADNADEEIRRAEKAAEKRR